MNLFNLFAGNKISNPKFKLSSNDIYTINPANQCIFYLEDSIPLVKKGDTVEAGQVLGKSKEENSASVISTVKGTVSEVSDKVNYCGKKVKAVVVSEIENVDLKGEKVQIDALTKEELLSKISEYALKDENGVSLAKVFTEFKGDKVVIKDTSLEPNFPHYVILKNMAEEFETGKKVINSILGVDITTDNEGEESLVIDLHTVIAIGESFILGCPQAYEYVSVFGSAADTNKLLKVKIGTVLSEIFEKLNGDNNKLYKVVIGGALKGNAQFTLDVAINTAVKGILFLNEKEGKKERAVSCIRCAKCLRVCPKGLSPIKLVELWERGDMEEFIKFGGDKCIDCGLCSYVCPSNIELSHIIKTAKEYKK